MADETRVKYRSLTPNELNEIKIQRIIGKRLREIKIHIDNNMKTYKKRKPKGGCGK